MLTPVVPKVTGIDTYTKPEHQVTLVINTTRYLYHIRRCRGYTHSITDTIRVRVYEGHHLIRFYRPGTMRIGHLRL